jgi:toxin ParE1/3/4
MAHRLAPRAERDLDDIWYFVAKESGSVDIASRLIDSIADRFVRLADFPLMGRARDHDFGIGCRSLAVSEYVIVYVVEKDDVMILRVAHGHRDIEALFSH